MLSIKNASLRYHEQVLFQHLNLHIAADEWLVILGKSGIGKTSLLRMMGGLTEAFPEADTVVGGDVECDVFDLSHHVTYMAQSDGLFPWLSLIDNVVVPCRLAGIVPDMDQARRLLSQVGLLEHAHKKPKALSGGMRQRAALARSLMQDKPVLLMDEPFSGLDALTRIEMQSLLLSCRATKKMLIMVTHDPWEALRLADRIVVLSGVPAQVQYTLNLPKTSVLRPMTPALLEHYNEILAAI